MKLGTSVGVGSATTIKLDKTKQTQLPVPYTHCTPQSTLGPIDQSTAYTESYCVDICIQQQFLRRCGCISKSFHFAYRQVEESNFTVCGFVEKFGINISVNVKKVGQMLCDQSFTPNKSICLEECLSPCQEYQYSSSVT